MLQTFCCCTNLSISYLFLIQKNRIDISCHPLQIHGFIFFMKTLFIFEELSCFSLNLYLCKKVNLAVIQYNRRILRFLYIIISSCLCKVDTLNLCINLLKEIITFSETDILVESDLILCNNRTLHHFSRNKSIDPCCQLLLVKARCYLLHSMFFL